MRLNLANISYDIDKKEYILNINCAGYEQGGTVGFGSTKATSEYFEDILTLMRQLHKEDEMRQFIKITLKTNRRKNEFQNWR